MISTTSTQQPFIFEDLEQEHRPVIPVHDRKISAMTSGIAQHAARIIPKEISMPARFDSQDRDALMEMVRTLSPESRRSLFSKHQGDVYEHSAYERQLLHSMFDDNLRA